VTPHLHVAQLLVDDQEGGCAMADFSGFDVVLKYRKPPETT